MPELPDQWCILAAVLLILKTQRTEQEMLKEVVERFEEAYPDGLDFAPNANDADFA